MYIYDNVMCFRELVTTIKFGPDVPKGLKVMLIHRWPRGVYVDPFELASLRDHTDLEVHFSIRIDPTVVHIHFTYVDPKL